MPRVNDGVVLGERVLSHSETVAGSGFKRTGVPRLGVVVVHLRLASGSGTHDGCGVLGERVFVPQRHCGKKERFLY